MADRALRVQREILARYDRIVNLWVTYHNSHLSPDVFGREFYCAVGELMQGVSLEKLSICHIDPKNIEFIVSHGSQDTKKRRKR